MRLDQYIARMGGLSRKEAKKEVERGNVKVNGAVIRSPKAHIDPDQSDVRLNDTALSYEPYVYYMLNKPAGYVCSTDDPKDPTVLGLVDRKGRALFPAGRLDKDTEGFVLLTDDGAFAHRMLSPARHVDKTYLAIAAGVVTDEDIQAFREGIDIGDDTPTRPARMERLDAGDGPVCLVLLTLTEGRYHQIKRMMAAIGKPVVYLKRIAIGGVYLDTALAPGAYRHLTGEEVERIEEASVKH